MKSQPQSSIQQRMREILIKLKEFGHHLPQMSKFKDYSLCLDRLEKLVEHTSMEITNAQEKKKKAAEELKNKNNQLKDYRKEIETLNQSYEQKQHEHQHVIITQKNTISELKRKLQNVKGSVQYYQYQKIKEENSYLYKRLQEKTNQLANLSYEKSKMISLVDFKMIEKKLQDSQKQSCQTEAISKKLACYKQQNRQHIEKIQWQRQQIKRLQSIILTQKQQISNDGQLISCLLDDQQSQSSLNSSQTCESNKDYEFQQINMTRSIKRKKNKKRSKIYKKLHTPIHFHTIQQESQEKSSDEASATPHSFQQKQGVKSFSVVMLFLAGVLAFPVPGWNC